MITLIITTTIYICTCMILYASGGTLNPCCYSGKAVPYVSIGDEAFPLRHDLLFPYFRSKAGEQVMKKFPTTDRAGLGESLEMSWQYLLKNVKFT